MSKKEKIAESGEELSKDDMLVKEDHEQPEAQESADKAPKKSTKKAKKASKEDKWKEEKAEMEQQVSDLKDKFIRLVAEFDNYKKRTGKERRNLMDTAAQDTLSALLPVLDDFDRAKKNAEDDASAEPLSEGVMLVYNKLYNVLRQRGLERMETNGEVFDPELHEAITEIPAPNEEMKGKIIDTVEKGYILKEKIIRHAKVVVGK